MIRLAYIYSTLTFVMVQCNVQKFHTSCITFDQPLYLKAITIAKVEDLLTVCQLGGFHTLMSYLRSVGTFIKGSGLK
jgi:hypothetical protein